MQAGSLPAAGLESVLLIPVNEIRLASDGASNYRALQPGVVDSLVESIGQHGFIGTIAVCAEGDGYVVVDGHHRYAAACRVGLESIPCSIVPSDGAARRAVQYAANIHASHSPIEEAHAFGRMRSIDGLDAAGIAQATGRRIGYVESRLALLGLPSDIASMVGGTLPIRVGVAIASLPSESAMVAAVKAIDRAGSAGSIPSADSMLAIVDSVRSSMESDGSLFGGDWSADGDRSLVDVSRVAIPFNPDRDAIPAIGDRSDAMAWAERLADSARQWRGSGNERLAVKCEALLGMARLIAEGPASETVTVTERIEVPVERVVTVTETVTVTDPEVVARAEAAERALAEAREALRMAEWVAAQASVRMILLAEAAEFSPIGHADLSDVLCGRAYRESIDKLADRETRTRFYGRLREYGQAKIGARQAPLAAVVRLSAQEAGIL